MPFKVGHMLISICALTVINCEVAKMNDGSDLAVLQAELQCRYMNNSDPSEDTILDTIDAGMLLTRFTELRKASRVCLPKPCDKLRAYSGYIPVDKSNKSSYLFFLHIKSEPDSGKPLLLWLQGGPGKSSLFGQFLENGPLGIDAAGKLYYREHTLLNNFNIIYLDQPVGSGYSFSETKAYPSSLDEASTHVITFLEEFLKIFPEYKDKDFYIAGESYGARSAVGVAQMLVPQASRPFPLHIKGVMLGVGFLFPLMDIINSTDFLYYTSLLDDCGRNLLAQRFDMIQTLAAEEQHKAAVLLSQTVLNLRMKSQQSLFESLSGFHHHGSITTPQRPREVLSYMIYANSSEFKKRIHVGSSRTLDGTRYQIALKLALTDFFVDLKDNLTNVLNNVRVLLYTAQLDAVFPAVNIEQSLKNLAWRGSEALQKANRTHWFDTKSSLNLLGYVKEAGSVMCATVLYGGHYVSLDRSRAVSELYNRFLEFQSKPSLPEVRSC
ncbi:probable serine carboxypeptidase CPVL [Dermacentor andersoni]|uniref:probable serine carboxypeptidase CPVL n=1 Tax=Dermacentor andersoni TaxID=34620 RepID=UPI00241635E7|nr:probable serine carboxypeptidase CPVL [Dermacentor andersoni]